MNPGGRRPNPRQDRWNRFEEWYSRRHPALQWALIPWHFSIQTLSFFPILVPTICGLGALLLAWLKWNYLEDMTWGQVAWLATSPFWVFVGVGYLFLTWVVVGCVPWAIVVFGQQWWEGKPFDFRGPDAGATDPARRELLAARRERRTLDRDLIQALIAVHESNECRTKLMMRVTGCAFVVPIIVAGMNWLGHGDATRNLSAIVLLMWAGTMSPIFLIYELHFQWRLRCHSCAKAIRWKDRKALLESNACPHCSGSPLLTVLRER